jgi:hypothetical protein
LSFCFAFAASRSRPCNETTNELFRRGHGTPNLLKIVPPTHEGKGAYRAKKTSLTGNSFPVCVEPLLDPIARFIRELLRSRPRHFIGMFVGRAAQKSDLFSVAATPFAEQQMYPQAELLAQRKLPVERGRLQAAPGRGASRC